MRERRFARRVPATGSSAATAIWAFSYVLGARARALVKTRYVFYGCFFSSSYFFGFGRLQLPSSPSRYRKRDVKTYRSSLVYDVCGACSRFLRHSLLRRFHCSSGTLLLTRARERSRITVIGSRGRAPHAVAQPAHCSALPSISIVTERPRKACRDRAYGRTAKDRVSPRKPCTQLHTRRFEKTAADALRGGYAGTRPDLGNGIVSSSTGMRYETRPEYRYLRATICTGNRWPSYRVRERERWLFRVPADVARAAEGARRFRAQRYRDESENPFTRTSHLHHNGASLLSSFLFCFLFLSCSALNVCSTLR